ncbi:MAG: hypothetical protein LBD55_00880, partial [Treponema sp.]|nr:hypothetical protein [Treponema sp.]
MLPRQGGVLQTKEILQTEVGRGTSKQGNPPNRSGEGYFKPRKSSESKWGGVLQNRELLESKWGRVLQSRENGERREEIPQTGP